MNKEQMLDELTRKYARKDLSFGCKFKTLNQSKSFHFIIVKVSGEFDGGRAYEYKSSKDTATYNTFFTNENIEIIGHELLLTDILKVLLGKEFVLDLYGELWSVNTNSYDSDNKVFFDRVIFKFDLSKPYLKDQPIETITAVYNLIK